MPRNRIIFISDNSLGARAILSTGAGRTAALDRTRLLHVPRNDLEALLEPRPHLSHERLALLVLRFSHAQHTRARQP